MKDILEEGKNCWCIKKAHRLAFLVDAAAYFEAFARSALNARESILIAGWDIDSRIRLFREGEVEGHSPVFFEFLNRLVKKEKKLKAHLLEWDFAVIYAFERQFFPDFRLPWKKNRRIHFHMDGEHPIGGAHHQKVVVMDDRMAFVGGIDLTRRRWDTPEHKPHDPRRIEPSGEHYGPFHDVQIVLEGQVASALGELIRTRWQRATGKSLEVPERVEGDLWPPHMVPDLEDVRVAVVRTDPAHKGREGIREVEALYLDTIAAAQRFIYIENQYLTSMSVGKALAGSLEKKEGPEIVIVLRVSSDWLEETTLGVLRAGLLAHLRRADVHGRLRIYYPHVPGLQGSVLNVHSKVMIVDGTFARVGSSNLTNRSMGVDTECDIALESSGEQRIEEGISRFMHRLLAEHLGVSSREMEGAMRETGSLIRSIEKLSGTGRTFLPFPREEISWKNEFIPVAVDPVEPIDPGKLLPEDVAQEGEHRLWRVLLLLGALLALAAAWRWTPLSDWVDYDTLVALGAGVKDSGMAPAIVLSAYVLGSLVMLPVTVLIMATAITFGPVNGFFYSMTGCVLAAMATYGMGRALGREAVSRLAGSRVHRLSRKLGDHGVLTVVTIRIIPFAPFTIINMFAGASHIRFRDFIVGTVLGMGPGIAAVTLFGHQLVAAIREPGWESFAILGIILIFMVSALYLIKARWFSKPDKFKKKQGEH